MRIFLTALCLLVLMPFAAQSVSEPLPLRLFSGVNISPQTLVLADADWRWLGEKKEVNIAVYQPAVPPFNLAADASLYEGVSADYTLLAMRYLGLRFHVLNYPDRDAALQGLRDGKVDIMIDDGRGQTRPLSGLVSSIPFMPDPIALIVKGSAIAKPPQITPATRIALVHGFVSDDWVKRHYPDTTITRYSSVQTALSSVAFGENDLFIGNMTSTSFLIERNYATTLSVAESFPSEDTGPRYLFRDTDIVLQRAVNAVLHTISPEQHSVILRHWLQGPNLWLSPSRLSLSDREKRWLEKRNALRVVINPLYAPFTIFDSQDQFMGIAADVLQQIHLRTGLNFRISVSDSVQDMFEQVTHKQGDFLAAMSYSPERDRKLLFTRPYVQTPFVLVVRDTLTAPSALEELRSIAVTPDNALRDWLGTHYPEIKLIEVQNASLAMKMVSEGKVDAAINNLIGAHYMINRFFQGELKIAARVGESPAQMAFAVGRDEPELYAILNKALADIPPRDLSLIVNKWQGTPDVKLDTWTVYRTEFYWLASIFTLLVITSLIWNYYLHREIKLRKEAKLRLKEQASFLAKLFNGTPVPVYVVGPEGDIINHNPAWDRFFSSAEMANGEISLQSLSHPLNKIWQDLNSAFNNAESDISIPQQYYVSDGTDFHTILHQAVAYTDSTGNVAGLICCWQDITEHKQLLAEVSDSRERAEHANRSKTTFLATMSHEIRTPISAIIGLLELVVTSKEYGETEKESIRVSYESAQSLMGLIGDILDMAKIESGKLELSPEWVRFDGLAEPVVRVFEGLARQKGLLLSCHIDALHPDEVQLDPMRMRQVISNLISNAIKFTACGSVDVHVRCATENPGLARLEISVTDTGAGISSEEQSRLFNPYAQADVGRKQSGTGLGLAICKQLVTMMGGEITLHSQSNRGTRVMVTIPVAYRTGQIPSLRHQPEMTENQIPLKILIVDDHPANRLLLTRQLLRLGHQVTEAAEGKEALMLYQNGQFDVVITDCSMPEMDGLELTRHLRKQSNEALIILGLTANAQPEERARCIASGMDDCLFKPLRLPQLEGILRPIPRHAISGETPPLALDNLVDLPALKKLVQNDLVLLHKLLSTTLIENKRDLEKAETMLTASSWSGLASSLHRMAGAAQIVCAAKMELRCRELEQYCEENPDAKEVIARFALVKESVMELGCAITIFIKDGTETANGNTP